MASASLFAVPLEDDWLRVGVVAVVDAAGAWFAVAADGIAPRLVGQDGGLLVAAGLRFGVEVVDFALGGVHFNRVLMGLLSGLQAHPWV